MELYAWDREREKDGIKIKNPTERLMIRDKIGLMIWYQNEIW